MSTVTLLPEAQTFTTSAMPTTSFGSTPYLVVGEVSSVFSTASDPLNTIYSFGAGTYYSWLRYDLSSIPSGATINSATLTVTALYSRIADYTSLAFGARRFTDITWSETITELSAPFASLTGGFYVGYMPVVGPGGEAEMNVKVMTQNALSTGKLSVFVSGSSVPDDFAILQSSKYGGGVSTPYLTVDYSVGDARRVVTAYFD
jgi:hypothetical protein